MILLLLCWIAGTLRAGALFLHDPLYAYANSYDETRYTSCFHFYPDRPASIPPQTHSPEAPYAKFRFQDTGDPMCYRSSELAFAAIAAAGWKLAELAGSGDVHDVRPVAAFRWLVLLAISMALSLAWLRAGNPRVALANAALVPLVFADPGNTLYLATFYAEWTALVAAYALIGVLLLWRDDIADGRRFAIVALAAFALATSKLQHMLLPLALAIVVFALARARRADDAGRVGALFLGALLGALFQLVQLGRDSAMIDTIRQYNAADVVFTALTPLSDDPAKLLAELDIDPACARFSGDRAWQLPDLPDRACAGLGQFSHMREIWTLLRHPSIAIRLAGRGVLALDPWIADNIGHVEGARFAPLPRSQWSIGRALHASPSLLWSLLAMPFLALVVLSMRRGIRAGGAALEATALAVVGMCATLAITLLGDGLADTAKQGHLLVDAALAWLVAGIIMLAPWPRSLARRPETTSRP